MTAIGLTHRLHLRADQATVWGILADYANDVAWRTGVSRMTCEPAGSAVVGARTNETIRLAGRTWHNVGVVTSVAPLARLEWRTIEGATAHGARSVAPTASGCRVTLELTVEPTGLSRLFTPYLRHLLDRNLREDLVRLASLVAARATWAGDTAALHPSR